MVGQEGGLLGRKSGWAGRVVGEEEWFGRRSGSGGRIVGEEEWLGRRSGWAGGVVGEEEWLGRTHARLHARLARNPCTHACLQHART